MPQITLKCPKCAQSYTVEVGQQHELCPACGEQDPSAWDDIVQQQRLERERRRRLKR